MLTFHSSDPMYLESVSNQLSKQEWERKMEHTKPINYKWLVAKIKNHIPKLYEDLCLSFPNPYANKCRVSKDYYILVHSAKEYFIKK